MAQTPSPAFARRDAELIPRWLVGAMIGLALLSLALVSLAVLTDRPHTGVPVAAPVLAERTLILEGHGAKAVTVRDAEGKLLADLPHGGFITVVQNGLQRARTLRGVDPMKPVRLVSYANGRLTVIDPETGWSVELGNFGDDNRAAFERLLKD
jgi:putative photosynthetic complex assembly protein